MSGFDTFKKLVKPSHAAVSLVASYLSYNGLTVQIGGLHVAPSQDLVEDYLDGGDLRICVPVEVKHLSRDFTCLEDWPFGDKFIVDAKDSYDRKKEQPARYIVVSKSMTHCAIVSVHATRPHWYAEPRSHQHYGTTKLYYFCPLKMVKFGAMEDLR